MVLPFCWLNMGAQSNMKHVLYCHIVVETQICRYFVTFGTPVGKVKRIRSFLNLFCMKRDEIYLIHGKLCGVTEAQAFGLSNHPCCRGNV